MAIKHGLGFNTDQKPVCLFGILEPIEAVGFYGFRPNTNIFPLHDPLYQTVGHFDKTAKNRFMHALHSLSLHLYFCSRGYALLGIDKYRKTISYHSEYAGLFAESFYYYGTYC